MNCPIRVDADLVSRRHAKLILKSENALIEDLGSSYGAVVNTPLTGGTRLRPCQKVRISAATVTLRRVQGEVPEDMSPLPVQSSPQG